MTCEFVGEIIYWRGPAPFVFVRVPEDVAPIIKEIAPLVTYGWGCLPAKVQIDGQEFSTALIPRNRTYFVPVKKVIQRACGVEVGQMRLVTLAFCLADR